MSDVDGVSPLDPWVLSGHHQHGGDPLTRATESGTTDIREFGHELWSYLTGKGAVVEYAFDQLSVEVPKTTGADSPRATWKLHGTVRIRTSDRDSVGSVSTPSGNGTR